MFFSRVRMALIVVCLPAPQAVGHGFATPPGHTQVHKMVQTASLFLQTVGFCSAAGLCKRLVSVWNLMEMALKDPLGSIVRVGYSILTQISKYCYMTFNAEKPV